MIKENYEAHPCEDTPKPIKSEKRERMKKMLTYSFGSTFSCYIHKFQYLFFNY